eukprot:gene38955-44163_t
MIAAFHWLLGVLMALSSISFARSFGDTPALGSSTSVVPAADSSLPNPCVFSVTSIGDFNRDGHPDFLAGCLHPDPSSTTNLEVLVVFSVEGSLPPLDFSAFVSGSAGFRMFWVNSTMSAVEVARDAGDVNNDGYADLLITLTSPNVVDPTVQTIAY